MSEHMARNDASRERLRRVLDRLDEAAAARRVDDEWTVGALLAHIAFWDRFVLARWEQAQGTGSLAPEALDAGMQDLINAAGSPAWHALSADAVRELALSAAEAIDRTIADLSREQLEAVRAAGIGRLIDRSLHRDEHLAEIERLLAG